MIEKLNVTKTIAVPPAEAWAAISGIGGLDRWFPIIASCRVEGEGEGAVRVLELIEGGGEIRDRIEEIDHRAKRFRYLRTESPFPVSRYAGTVEVRDVAAGKSEVSRSEVSWTVEIDVSAEGRSELVGLIVKALSDGVSGLEQDFQGR